MSISSSAMKNYEFYSNANLLRYAGEWVAIIEGEIVGHHKSLDALLKKLKKGYPSTTPFLTKVPTKEVVIW